MRRDGGGAKIDRQPVKPALMQAGPDIEDLEVLRISRLMERDAHLPIALAQGRLQFLEDAKRRGCAVDLPLVAQCRAQPFEIARGFVHVGFDHLDQHQPRGGVHGDGAA